MNLVLSTIRKHIGDQNFHFVFPSQIAASLWAGKTCTLGIVRSVASNRFLAWDSFKEEAIRERLGEKALSPASSVTRKLFAEYLIRKNAQSPFLKSIIPPEYAETGNVFASYIARLLPSLHSLEKLIGSGADAEDHDYKLIKSEYSSFLEKFSLFEPSWEDLVIKESLKRYVLFFPELIEDFSEYDTLLSEPGFIRVNTEKSLRPEITLFHSAREEIQSSVLEMRKLHEEENIPFQEMAISIPDLEEMESWLQLELSLHHIPFTRRAGKKLGESGAGRLFSLLSEAVAQNFSFNSLKALLLNDHIPWIDSEKNKALVNFGIKYNCVKSYTHNGKPVDIWNDALREAKNDGGEDLLPYYSELKKLSQSLVKSKDFSELRKNYFVFRHSFLDMDKISREDDAVLSRCIEELHNLATLEESFNNTDIIPQSPLNFFISCLSEKEYVLANQEPGINIFKWRVAAACPFTCHFVLNASQKASTVLYQPLKFLRQDKRKALGLEDFDASWAFFTLCETGDDELFKSRCRISASSLSYGGWVIPHSFFAHQAQTPLSETHPHPENPYITERRFWSSELNEDALLPGIYPIQKRSFEKWKETIIQKENDFSFFSSPIINENVRTLLYNMIFGEDNFLKVTPTMDLNEYYKCSLKWLFKRILSIEEFSLEAKLLDDLSLGILYHRILEMLFRKIKTEDRFFTSARLDSYKKWAYEIAREVIASEGTFKGPLAIPLVSPQAEGIAKKIAGLLDLEALYFDQYEIAELELSVSLELEELLIKGIIDRVSISTDGEPLIFDYKTGDPPRQTDLADLENVPLSEFQMPLYIKLYEEMSHNTIEGAYFYNIKGCSIRDIVDKTPDRRSKALKREEYVPYLEALDIQIKQFSGKVKALDFIPREINLSNCRSCDYKTICRSTYSEGNL